MLFRLSLSLCRLHTVCIGLKTLFCCRFSVYTVQNTAECILQPNRMGVCSMLGAWPVTISFLRTVTPQGQHQLAAEGREGGSPPGTHLFKLLIGRNTQVHVFVHIVFAFYSRFSFHDPSQFFIILDKMEYRAQRVIFLTANLICS